MLLKDVLADVASIAARDATPRVALVLPAPPAYRVLPLESLPEGLDAYVVIEPSGSPRGLPEGAAAVYAEASRLPFREESVGLLLCFACIEKADELEGFLKEACRVLGAGGRLVIGGLTPSSRLMIPGSGEGWPPGLFAKVAAKHLSCMDLRVSKDYFVASCRCMRR